MPTVILKGEAKPLRFEFEAICAMQELHGLNVFDEAAYSASPRTVAILIWGGLLHLGKEAPTYSQVKQGMTMADYKANTQAVYEALGDSLPKKEEADATLAPA